MASFYFRNLYWMQDWLIRGKVEEPHLGHIYCASPSTVKGRQLIDLNLFDWVSSET